jgi:hypothetical protein
MGGNGEEEGDIVERTSRQMGLMYVFSGGKLNSLDGCGNAHMVGTIQQITESSEPL